MGETWVYLQGGISTGLFPFGFTLRPPRIKRTPSPTTRHTRFLGMARQNRWGEHQIRGVSLWAHFSLSLSLSLSLFVFVSDAERLRATLRSMQHETKALQRKNFEGCTFVGAAQPQAQTTCLFGGESWLRRCRSTSGPARTFGLTCRAPSPHLDGCGTPHFGITWDGGNMSNPCELWD